MTVKTPIFNPKKRKLLRKHVPVSENLITLGLLATLVGIVVWFAAQKDNYDPGKRDLAIELLIDQPAGPELYDTPLQPWAEPGAMASGPATVDLGLFPPAIADAQWQAASRVREFGPENLYEKINGEAEKFLRQGFQSLNYVVLKDGSEGTEIAIELYDQGNMGGSMGIFSEHLGGDRTVEQAGPVVYFRTSAGVIGRKGKFFFRVAGSDESDAIQEKSVQLATAFAALPESEDELPPEFRLLRDRLDIAPELITYQRKNVFQYDFVENFWFGAAAQDSPERVFIHHAESAAAATELFAELLDELSYDYEITEQSEDRALLWQEFLKNHFAIAQRGPFIFGIENAADEARITPLLDQFLEELPLDPEDQ